MKKILAISGGVDSMCLLDMFKNDPEAIVAHFNHGTRPSSDDDQLFVAAFAKKYQLPFYTKKSILGPDVSEADARAARYDFLNELAEELNGRIYTAHHLNDLFESIAINIARGTGWRGLTPFNNSTIEHPLLHFSKTEIYRYAYANGIVYRQDPTNTDSSYLRNRLRPAIAAMIIEQPDLAEKLHSLYLKQTEIRQEIETLSEALLPRAGTYPRAAFITLDDATAIELLRQVLASHQISVTRPKLHDFLDAIRTYRPGKQFNLPKDRLVRFNKTSFML